MFFILIQEKYFFISYRNPKQVNLIKMINNVNISKKNGTRQIIAVTSEYSKAII